MHDFEKLGAFYLGRVYDPAARAATAAPVLYDSADLVTHALCVGMTGSGKTGLGIALLEEAAIDGVPAIVIDPKGDLTNLLLTFPNLRPEDFEPWVDEDDARRAGRSRAEFAADQAALWTRGLAEWGQDGARIQRLRDAAELTIYTPGSTAGVPVSALASFARPTAGDPELLRERAQTIVSSLLGLAGVESAPMKGREHVLLATLLGALWQSGEDPDLPSLVHGVQQPPFTRIGVMDVDSFFPPKERFECAMALNALVASPGFSVWTEGEPLDVAAFLRTRTGRPRVSIFSIAHLDDGQRMFFVALLLNAVVGWMRAQGGTSSLRALLYMDEIFGFFPPVASPPSKPPLLTLLKQARAAGLGLVLATQNPVDLDYKGLSNIGTWWLGRLQTDRDKARVLDGLEGAAASSFDRAEMDRLLSGLTGRVFLMRNVHEDGLTLFQSRWALSYLRGPLGREEIRALTGAGHPRETGTAPPAAPSPDRPESDEARPVLPPDIPQYFAPGGGQVLVPMAYGAVDVRLVDRKLKIDEHRLVALAAPISDGAVAVEWEHAARVELDPAALSSTPPPGARFAPLPAAAARARNYAAWGKALTAWIAANESLELLRSAPSGLVSTPGESERDFRSRLQQAAREARDAAVAALRQKYGPKQAALGERLRRARQALDREQEQASGQKVQTAISVGTTLLGALLGRKAVSAGTIGRATTAARGVGRSMKEAGDVSRARETIAAVETELGRLDEQLQGEIAGLEAASAGSETLERVLLKPKRGDTSLKVIALVWR